MIARKLSHWSVAIPILVSLAAFASIANAQSCSNPVTGTVTCTGGAGSHVTDTNNGAISSNWPTVAAQTNFPSTIAVTGGGAAVKTVSITLHGYTSEYNTSGSNNYFGSAEMGLMLVSPSNHNLEVLRCVGETNFGENNITVTLADGNTLAPDCETTNSGWTSGTYSPASYHSEENEPNYTQAGAPALQHAAGVGSNSDLNGNSTLNSVNGVFTGDTINGDWKLYLVSDAFFETNVQFSSWDITITYTAATESTTTSLSADPSPAFTSGNGSSVTLTATVTGSGATGTVQFQNGSSTIANCGAQPLNSSGVATCNTSFTSEGLQSLSATYSGDGTFEGSSGTAGLFTYNHATNTGTTYCNAGTIASPGSVDVLPYPSVIDVTNLGSDSVSTVSVTLKSFSSNDTNGLHMLLESPDGNHTLEFWGDAGAGTDTSGNYTIQDGSTAIPNSALSPGTYSPTANFNYLVFTLGEPLGAPAPQPPSGTSFSMAEPAGSATFETSFVGATANGTWLLFVDNEGTTQMPTSTTASIGGWCIDITPATGHGTTVSVTSSATPYATKGSAVSFTATVTSPGNGTVNEGTVTFTENGSPLTGAPNSGVASVSGGVATISTSSLPEGDHTITATYNDSSDTFNENFGTVSIREDAATATPTLNGITWTYCNPTGITIPDGTVFTNDTGPASPNPSNIFVTNLPGTIGAVTLTINSFSVEFPGELESLLVGPAGPTVPFDGTPAPGTAQTLDFFSPNDGVNLTQLNSTVTFADTYSPVPANANSGTAVGTQVGPTSNGPTSYTASSFYTLPGTLNHATTQGNFDFDNSVHGVYPSSNPNGTWSLYFDQTEHHTGDSAASWCMNFTEIQPGVSATESHLGSSPSNQFTQGQQNAPLTTVITNSGPGSTGDPDGNHPMTVTDTLDSAFAYASFSGTDWSCTANLQVVTCVNHEAIAADASYPTLTIDVNVSDSAGSPISNHVGFAGGGILLGTSTNDSITIYPAPVLSVTKSHSGTFTQGQTAVWTITVNNTATNSVTSGTTTVTDTMPSGYTISGTPSGTGWNCSTSTSTVLTCTSSQVVAGGASFNSITVTVNVPATSPTSVSNTAAAYGGGDFTHTSGSPVSSNTDTATVVQVPASFTINGGPSAQTQSTTVSTAFASLAVTVKDAAGVVILNPPTPTSVVFTATTGTNGQSGTFSNNTNTITVSTNTSGIADPGTFTANGKAGSYTVGVATSPSSSASTSFSLTNTSPPATVQSVSSSNTSGIYTIGAMINVIVTFNKAVNVTGTPTLALNSGGTASYTTGTGTAALTFVYMVGSGQSANPLDDASSTALSLNGGTINDSTGTPATLTLPAPGTTNSLSASGIVIAQPSATLTGTSTTFPATNGNTTSTTQLTFTLTNNSVFALSYTPSVTSTTGNAGDFLVDASSTCANSGGLPTASALAANGGSCTFVIDFHPTANGAESARLNVSYLGLMLSSNLSGTGIGASLAPAAVFFPDTPSPTTQTLTFTNFLASSLSYTPSISGPNSGDFVVQSSSTCANSGGAPVDGSLSPQSSCTYVLAFSPSATGPESASLIISDADGTQSSNLMGLSGVTITETGLLYSPLLPNSNGSPGGGTTTFTVTNTGSTTISGPIQLVLMNLPAGVTPANNTGTFNGSPYWTVPNSNSLASGASLSVVVQLNYAASTAVSATPAIYTGSQP